MARRRSEQKARKYSLVFVLSSEPSLLKKNLKHRVKCVYLLEWFTFTRNTFIFIILWICNDETLDSFKNTEHKKFTTKVQKPHQVWDQNDQNRCSISDQNGLKKTYPLRLDKLFIAHIRENPSIFGQSHTGVSQINTYSSVLMCRKLELICCSFFSTIGSALLPDFIPWGTRYESVNYGISNYWST